MTSHICFTMCFKYFQTFLMICHSFIVRPCHIYSFNKLLNHVLFEYLIEIVYMFSNSWLKLLSKMFCFKRLVFFFLGLLHTCFLNRLPETDFVSVSKSQLTHFLRYMTEVIYKLFLWCAFILLNVFYSVNASVVGNSKRFHYNSRH